jgi:molybdenum cofactor biosynthesis enzyme MoaA
MRFARVLTNETCNQNCGFCSARRPHERASFARAEAVLSRIEAAAQAGVRELVLTGGEPTLRKDLPILVARAKRSGGEGGLTVTLETNAALISEAGALALARAGLDKARVHLPAWGEEADAISRDEGGFARTRAGMAALARAGIALEVATPIVRANLTRVPELPARLAAEGPWVTALVLGVPVSGPDPSALVSMGEAAAAIDAAQEQARSVGLAVRLDPGSLLPPCAFSRPSRVAHLFSLTRGGASRPGYRLLEGCAACAVRDRCPGVPEAARCREPSFEVRPITEDRTRRRLSLVASVEEQIARELVTRDVRRMIDGRTVRESIVRVNFHCNQACRFCFVSTHLPAAESRAIEAAIAEIAAVGGVLTLSGGEPTLNPRLVEFVRMGKELGARHVELQTNAIRLADPALSRELALAGVDVAFVSLHASNAALSDRITEAPGTFEKTVRGIEEARKAGLDVRLNFVFCEANKSDFPAYIEMVGRRFPGVTVTVSHVAASTDVVPFEASLIPRYADVMPAMAEGVRRAKRLGVSLSGFESMCGIPLCQVPDDLSPFFRLSEVPPDGGEFVKAAACASCALERRCFGVRRGYAELHGTSELCAVKEARGRFEAPQR